jgi:hypothetical protein
MANAKRQQTIAKRDRERAVAERRTRKREKKQAARRALSEERDQASDSDTPESAT